MLRQNNSCFTTYNSKTNNAHGKHVRINDSHGSLEEEQLAEKGVEEGEEEEMTPEWPTRKEQKLQEKRLMYDDFDEVRNLKSTQFYCCFFGRFYFVFLDHLHKRISIYFNILFSLVPKVK